MKQHERCFDECSKFLDQREQSKLQWVQDPRYVHVNNLNNFGYKMIKQFKK